MCYKDHGCARTRSSFRDDVTFLGPSSPECSIIPTGDGESLSHKVSISNGPLRGRYGAHPKPIRGPSEVDTGSIRGQYGDHPRSIRGPSEVDTGVIRGRYGVHLRSIRGPSEVDTGSIRSRYGDHPRSIRGPSEVDIGSIRSQLFFQAEDGIRDLVRSRGLGDVYKRQF